MRAGLLSGTRVYEGLRFFWRSDKRLFSSGQTYRPNKNTGVSVKAMEKRNLSWPIENRISVIKKTRNFTSVVYTENFLLTK